MQYWVVFPLVELPHSVATAAKRAETVLRTVVLVDLKYSLNLVAEPDVAAVDAAVANCLQYERALKVLVLLVPVQPLWTTVRSSKLGRARLTFEACFPSTVTSSWLLL